MPPRLDRAGYRSSTRDAMAVDALDEAGVYFGTAGGQVYASASLPPRFRLRGGHFARPPDRPLPKGVASEDDVFCVMGAISGG